MLLKPVRSFLGGGTGAGGDPELGHSPLLEFRHRHEHCMEGLKGKLAFHITSALFVACLRVSVLALGAT